MKLEHILHYIDAYGYLLIFVLLCFGIAGIPAPEESLLFLIGILIGYHTLSFKWAFVSSFSGVLVGMIIAYFIGKYVGTPFFDKYGKYMGLTPERIEQVKKFYSRNAYRTIVFSLYIPVVRQISPYFAGIVGVPFGRYVLLSTIGSALWTIPIIILGYYAGYTFHISPKYAPYIGVVVAAIFLTYLLMKKLVRKKQK